MLYYFYSSIAGIALVVHLIINWRQLVNWRSVNSRAGANEYRHFLVCLLFCFIRQLGRLYDKTERYYKSCYPPRRLRKISRY